MPWNDHLLAGRVLPQNGFSYLNSVGLAYDGPDVPRNFKKGLPKDENKLEWAIP